MDLEEIKMLEKIATIKESQGGHEHEEFLKESSKLIEQELSKSSRSESKRQLYPYSNTKETLNDVSIEYGDDDRPLFNVASTDFL